jgi:hypothetical protein
VIALISQLSTPAGTWFVCRETGAVLEHCCCPERVQAHGDESTQAAVSSDCCCDAHSSDLALLPTELPLRRDSFAPSVGTAERVALDLPPDRVAPRREPWAGQRLIVPLFIRERALLI